MVIYISGIVVYRSYLDTRYIQLQLMDKVINPENLFFYDVYLSITEFLTFSFVRF